MVCKYFDYMYEHMIVVNLLGNWQMFLDSPTMTSVHSHSWLFPAYCWILLSPHCVQRGFNLLGWDRWDLQGCIGSSSDRKTAHSFAQWAILLSHSSSSCWDSLCYLVLYAHAPWEHADTSSCYDNRRAQFPVEWWRGCWCVHVCVCVCVCTSTCLMHVENWACWKGD